MAEPDRLNVYGIHAVRDCLMHGRPEKLLVRSGSRNERLEELVALAGDRDVPVEEVSPGILSELVEGRHQGVVLLASAISAGTSLDTILQQEVRQRRLFLLLDGITDPGNLGACLRSAATLGVEAVIAPKNASAPLNEVARKRASGAADRIPYLRVVNLVRAMEKLREAGVWILGTAADADQIISGIDLTDDIALVMGSEGKGLRRNTAKHCDFLARIPMAYDGLGFNVSVATGICLYETWRQRAA